MTIRLTTKTATFLKPFTSSGYPGELPAGDYEILVEEERLQGLTFETYRRTATYLTVHGNGAHAAQTELRMTTESDLKEVLRRDQATTETNNQGEAALSPLEDRT